MWTEKLICLAILTASVIAKKWTGLSFDSKYFMCEHFDDLCENILDEVDCSETGRVMIGCPGYPTVLNNVSHWVGKCSCTSPITYTYPGARITNQLMSNRIGPDMKWLLEPWNKGPPYDIQLSYSIICDKLMDRINCPEDSRTISAQNTIPSGSTTNFKCKCGTLNADSYVNGAMIDTMNSNKLSAMPIFSNPVYLSVPISIAIVLITGKLAAAIAVYLKLPPIIGFILIGFGIENILNPVFLKGAGYPNPSPSSGLKTIALIIILMRAGLALKIEEIRDYSYATFFLCTLPYLGEFFFFMYLGTYVLGFPVIDMGLFASIMAPLSPSLVISGLLDIVGNGDKNYGYTPKQTLIAAPIETVLSIILFSIFERLETTETPPLYPWVKVYPLYANCLLIPLSIAFSAAMGVVLGYCISVYINYRVTIKSDLLWVRISKNPQMGSSTADLIYVLLVGCYTMYHLCTIQYIQQASGVLVVFVSCVVVSRLTTPNVVVDLAQALKGIWVFAEVFLFVLTGTSISFDSTNGPLYGQRGMDQQTIGKIFSLMVAGTAGRLVGLGMFIALVAPTFPKHRQTWQYLIPFWFNIWIYQLPKATVQATLGGVAYTTHIIPGPEGLNRALLISQATAFTILIFAPLGALLYPYVAAPLSLYIESLDKAAGWDSTKNRPTRRATIADAKGIQLQDVKMEEGEESEEEEDEEDIEQRMPPEPQVLHPPETIVTTLRRFTLKGGEEDVDAPPTIAQVVRRMSRPPERRASHLQHHDHHDHHGDGSHQSADAAASALATTDPAKDQ